jgi:meiotic recombination protein SPO11
MSNYKHGSYNLSHKNEHLNVPGIRWLGIKSSDIVNEADGTEARGLLRLSGRDRKKAVKMLENGRVLQEGGGEAEWRRELQVMLMLHVKAEMEILSERQGGVEEWVEENLVANAGTV